MRTQSWEIAQPTLLRNWKRENGNMISVGCFARKFWISAWYSQFSSTTFTYLLFLYFNLVTGYRKYVYYVPCAAVKIYTMKLLLTEYVCGLNIPFHSRASKQSSNNLPITASAENWFNWITITSSNKRGRIRVNQVLLTPLFDVKSVSCLFQRAISPKLAKNCCSNNNF